jgi:hypothetical protein
MGNAKILIYFVDKVLVICSSFSITGTRVVQLREPLWFNFCHSEKQWHIGFARKHKKMYCSVLEFQSQLSSIFQCTMDKIYLFSIRPMFSYVI